MESRFKSFGHDSTPKEYPVPFSSSDLIACPSSTFHPDGVANYMSGCMNCPKCVSVEKESTCNYLGQIQCLDQSLKFVRGDMNGDGILSQREVLRLFYVVTEGMFWGRNYSKWAQMNVNECSLPGIHCKEGKVTKIDLRGATLCVTKPCEGIPREIGELGESLEVLDLSTSFSSHVSIEIPSSIGMLTKLKILDLSHNHVKEIPSEIGLISSLHILNLLNCGYHGPIPPAIWKLKELEILNLNENLFTDQKLPSDLGHLTNLKELLFADSHIKGTIPFEIGALTNLKNLEIYDNELSGTLPSSFKMLRQMKRIDMLNNTIEGTLDWILDMPEIEVLNVRDNKFHGRIPSKIGDLKMLAWVDLSGNMFTGEIPSSFADILNLRNLRLGNNRLQPPIPPRLCQNLQINGPINPAGYDATNACNHIICPMGTHSKRGLGSPVKDSTCQQCDEGETTLHLGQTSCLRIGQYEMLTMFDALMNNKEWKIDKVGSRNKCDLEVATCDDDGQVIGLNIPLAGIRFDEELFQG